MSEYERWPSWMKRSPSLPYPKKEEKMYLIKFVKHNLAGEVVREQIFENWIPEYKLVAVKKKAEMQIPWDCDMVKVEEM